MSNQFSKWLIPYTFLYVYIIINNYFKVFLYAQLMCDNIEATINIIIENLKIALIR